MNRRQKKKRYKKLYGHNPPKRADGRYLFHVQYGADLAAGQDHTGYYIPEQRKTLKTYSVKSVDIELINNFREAIEYATKGMSDFAKAVSQNFANLKKRYRKPMIDQVEEPPVVLARKLSERRKKCRKKEWRASRR